MNLNKVLIAGNLTRDPEMKYTPKGTAVCQFGVAVNRKWKNDAGESQEEVTFIDVTLWGVSAENFAKWNKKGASVYIEGRLKLDTWDDKTTGQKRSKLTVVGETWQFCGGKAKEAGSAPARSGSPAKAADPLNGPPEEDEIPF